MLTTQAVVLRQWDFSETSQTVALFTRTHGLVRGLAKGAKREKSRFSGGLEPVTRGELLFIEPTKSDLATLTEWDLQEVFWGARRSYKSHLAALYLCDLLSRTVADNDPHPRLFDDLVRLLRALDEDDAHPRVVLEAQWKLLHETGSSPNLTPPEGTRAVGFDPARGAFVDDPGPDGPLDVWRVRRETLDLLACLAETDRTPEGTPAEGVRRAASLLAAFLVHALGRDLTTRAAYFDHEPLPNARRSG
ncbi:MAG: DNA repair protein RecO [Planctomycetota bacterium]